MHTTDLICLGAWFLNKWRTQAKQTSTYQAAKNMRKAGVPVKVLSGIPSRSQSRTFSVNQSFQQRITRQPVRAVHAGAGRLSRGEEAGNVRCSPQVSFYAAHDVVGRGGDRNLVFGDIDAEGLAGPVDAGETLGHVIGI